MIPNIDPAIAACPAKGELPDLAENLLRDPERISQIHAHLEICSSCAEAWRQMNEPTEEINMAALDAEVADLERLDPELAHKLHRLLL